MIKNKLAIQVWQEFEAEHGRRPTLQEFKDIGYSKAHYYTTWQKIRELRKEQEAAMIEQREEDDNSLELWNRR